MKTSSFSRSRFYKVLFICALLMSTGISRSFAATLLGNYTTHVNALNPVVYYQMNGDLTNSATGSYAITNSLVNSSGGVSYVAGPKGPTYDGFNNANQAVTNVSSTNRLKLDNSPALNIALNGASGLTLSAWINLNSTSLSGTWDIMQGSNGTNTAFQFFITSTGLSLGGRSTSVDGFQTSTKSFSFSLNTWYNVVGVLDFVNKTMSYYVNGDLLGSAISVTGWSSTTFAANTAVNSNLAVGTDANGGGNGNPSGSIDEAIIYKSALSSGQISDLYQSSLVPEPTAVALCGLAAIAVIFGRRRNG